MIPRYFLGAILTLVVASIVFFATHGSNPPKAVALAQTSSVVDVLSSDGSKIEVTGEPLGISQLHAAFLAGNGCTSTTGIKYSNFAASKLIYTLKDLPTGYKCLDLQAINVEGKAIGNWAGRKELKAESVEPPKPSGFTTSLDSGGWWLTNDSALNSGKLKLQRSQNMSNEVISKYEGFGWKSIDLIGRNPATAVNAESLANEAVARAKAHPSIVASEVLNEPQNPYLSGSESQANIEAYARVVNTVANKFASAGMTTAPKILWSCDGGFRGVPSWGSHVWPLLNSNARNLGRPTEHPYGGTGERVKSALGNRARVEECYKLTGEKSWVTEVGWPTAVGKSPTGDSLQWTESEQAKNIESFIKWAPPYTEDVTVFQYRDYGENDYYGIETKAGTHKSSFSVLEGS